MYVKNTFCKNATQKTKKKTKKKSTKKIHAVFVRKKKKPLLYYGILATIYGFNTNSS